MCADPQAGALISPPFRQRRCWDGDVVLSRAAVVHGLLELLLPPVLPGSRQEQELPLTAGGEIFIPPRAPSCRQEPRARTGSSILWQCRQAAQTVLDVAKNRCERDVSKDYLCVGAGKLSLKS